MPWLGIYKQYYNDYTIIFVLDWGSSLFGFPNTGVDTLISVRLADLTPTEQNRISFLEKLKSDTLSDKLTWEAESPHILNQMEQDCDGYVAHPLFSFATFYEDSECEHPNQVQRVVFICNNPEPHA